MPIKLWYHEMMRKFKDRFNYINDRGSFKKTMCLKHFRSAIEAIAQKRQMMFNDFSDNTAVSTISSL